MKKVICMLIAVLMVIGCAVSVSAAEFYQGGYDNSYPQDTGEITVTAHQYSRYTISIPETLDTADMNGGEVTVSNASLENGMSIFVAVTNMESDYTIPVTHKAKEGVTAKVAIGGNYGNATHRDIICKFDGAELESNNGEMTSQIRTNIVGQPEAGEYEGTITYAISCVPNT